MVFRQDILIQLPYLLHLIMCHKQGIVHIAGCQQAVCGIQYTVRVTSDPLHYICVFDVLECSHDPPCHIS